MCLCRASCVHFCFRSNWTSWSCWRVAFWMVAKKTKSKLDYFSDILGISPWADDRYEETRWWKWHADCGSSLHAEQASSCLFSLGVTVWSLLRAFTIFRGCVIRVVLFVRSCSPVRCPRVMDWINGLGMKPASFCLFSETGSPSNWESEVRSLLGP